MGTSLVLKAARENTDAYKKRDDDNIPLISAKTDFTIYDYMNAYQDAVVGQNGMLTPFLNRGMTPGYHSFIGKSQSGKTSLTVKLAGNIVQRYPNSVLYFRDPEKTTTDARIYSLTGWDVETFENKLDYVRYGVDHDFLFNDIRRICQIKQSLRDQIMIDTGLRDAKGKPIKVYPPDVYIVDSLQSLKLIDDDDEVKTGVRSGNNTDVKDVNVNRHVEGLVTAGSNKLLLNKLSDMVYQYNIRLILINHIVKNTGEIGSNSRYIQKQMQFLKQDEKLPGGVAYLYQCTNITRAEFGSRLEDNEFGPDIVGSRNRINMIKNKSNLSGVPVEVIFDQRHGYNSLLSSFNYIQNRGYGLDGSPRGMNLKMCPSYSFTKRNLWEKLVKDFQEYNVKAPLVNALIATTQRCMYYDFVVGRPDPNPENWSSSAVRMSAIDGVTSK